jgi:hypothetical protein
VQVQVDQAQTDWLPIALLIAIAILASAFMISIALVWSRTRKNG